MKTWRRTLVRLVVLSGLAHAAHANSLPCEVVPAVVRIHGSGTDGSGSKVETPTGTGFVVGSGGDLVTAFHVVGKDSANGRVVRWGLRADGEEDRTYHIEGWGPNESLIDLGPAIVIEKDETNDVAYLKLTESKLPSVVCSDRLPQEDDEVGRIGWQEKKRVYDRNRGRVARADPGDVGNRIRINLPSQPGHSGGPVFDDEGRVVALVTSGRDGNWVGGETYATPIEFATRLLPADALCRQTAPRRYVFSECEVTARDGWTTLLRLSELGFYEGGRALSFRDLLVAANFSDQSRNTVRFGTPSDAGEFESFRVEARRIPRKRYQEIVAVLPAYDRGRAATPRRVSSDDMSSAWLAMSSEGAQIGVRAFERGNEVHRSGDAIRLLGGTTARVEGIPGGVAPIGIAGEDGDVIVVLTEWESSREPGEVDPHEETFGLLHLYDTQRAVMLTLMDETLAVNTSSVRKKLFKGVGQPLEGLGTPDVFSGSREVAFDAAGLPRETKVELGWSWASH